MTEENIFCYSGLLDKKTHYIPAVGVIDYFWTLRPYTRQRILQGWITALQKIAENEDFEPEQISGAMLVFPHEEIVDYKEPDNIVQFPTISRNL